AAPRPPPRASPAPPSPTSGSAPPRPPRARSSPPPRCAPGSAPPAAAGSRPPAPAAALPPPLPPAAPRTAAPPPARSPAPPRPPPGEQPLDVQRLLRPLPPPQQIPQPRDQIPGPRRVLRDIDEHLLHRRRPPLAQHPPRRLRVRADRHQRLVQLVRQRRRQLPQRRDPRDVRQLGALLLRSLLRLARHPRLHQDAADPRQPLNLALGPAPGPRQRGELDRAPEAPGRREGNAEVHAGSPRGLSRESRAFRAHGLAGWLGRGRGGFAGDDPAELFRRIESRNAG